MVHCCLYGEASSYLVELIMPTAVASNRTGLKSAQSPSVAVPLGDCSFAAAAFRLWTNLTLHVERRLKQLEICPAYMCTFHVLCLFCVFYVRRFFRLHRMHETQTVVTDDRVRHSVSLFVTRLNSASLCKNGWTDQDADWNEHSRDQWNIVLNGSPDSPSERGWGS